MQVDIIGIDDVLKYIEATKLSKFTVQRQSGAGYIPCFECTDSESNLEAISEFTKWANIIKNNMPYKLSCFDIQETIIDSKGVEKLKKGRKAGKMECTFVLNQSFGSNKNEPTEQHFDQNDFRKQVIKEIAEQNEKNEILNEIKALRLKFAELEEEEEEEPVDENSIGGISGNQISQIMGLVNLFKQQQNPSLNGIEPVDINIQKENINKAIKILYKNNKQLDTDLLKLAELSETKKDTFDMLLQTLRNM